MENADNPQGIINKYAFAKFRAKQVMSSTTEQITNWAATFEGILKKLTPESRMGMEIG